MKIVNSPEMLEDDDTKYKKIIKSLKEMKEISTSFIQRKFALGYARTAKLLDRLEKDGFVGPAKGLKPRLVIKKLSSKSRI